MLLPLTRYLMADVWKLDPWTRSEFHYEEVFLCLRIYISSRYHMGYYILRQSDNLSLKVVKVYLRIRVPP
jgi:hypothetical protein